MRWNLLRLLALAAGTAFLTAGTCGSDNLGNGGPGPVSFRISIAPNTVEANGPSESGTISADGRFACFSSLAKNLTSPTSTFREIFVRDRETDTIRNVSRLASVFDPNTREDCQRPYIAPGGQYVVFESKGELTFDISSGSPENFPGKLNIFLVDLTATPIGLLRIPNVELDADCTNPSVSDDGRYIAFQTTATNVPNFPNAGGREQIYVYDRNLNEAILVSHGTGGATTLGDRDSENPRISANGALVAFESFSTNLTPEPNPLAHFDNVPTRRIYVAAPDGTGLELVSRGNGAAGTPADNHCAHASISGDGRYVAYIYQGGTMIAGAPASPDGGYLLRRDRDPGSLTTIVMGDRAFHLGLFVSYGITGTTGISDDGRFGSYLGINPVGPDLQVSVGRAQGGIIAASRQILPPGATFEFLPDTAISGDGRWVAWNAETPNEVLGDTNAVMDVFGYGPVR